MAKSVFFCLCIQVICVMFTHGKHLQTKDQQFIDSLQQYEYVQPKLSEPLKVGGLTSDVPVKEKRLLSFSFQGQTIKILLTLNRNLLSPNFFERYVTKHGYEIVNEAPRNCYFHGHVEGHKDTSIAAISTCDGIEGYFTLKDKTFSIQPVKSLKGEVFHIVFESEHVKLPKYRSDHGENATRETVEENVPEAKYRVRRDVLSETKYVEMVMVNDMTQYNKHGSETSTRAIKAANYADSTYRFQNIRVVLTMIEIWKDADQITHSTKNAKFLANFVEYKKKVLDKNETTKSDHTVLITQRKLQFNRQGWAGTLTICSPSSASLVHDIYSPSICGSVLAHELGHSFGFGHITSKCSCREDKQHKCLMNKDVSYSPLKWSNCTEAKLKSILLGNYGTCLFNRPTKHYVHAKCQNAFVDAGEECDCGTKEECEQMKNHCCNYTTCELHPGSECDDGMCCENCKIKAKGSMCREKVNDCDVPEYCDGKNPICAPDIYVHNGRQCSVGQEKNLCYLGVCHTHDNQCKTYWGADGYFSKRCYDNLNVRSNSRLGYCKLLGEKKYMKCAKKDVLCGKLQCEMSKHIKSRRPLTGGDAVYADYGNYICWSGRLDPHVPHIGMVETGTMCADNKVCYNNTCLDVNEVYPQPECPNNCSGNGICNNLGHCHCNRGYGCPNCSEKCDSEGGSVDSGNHCYCPVPTITPKTTVIGGTTRQQTTPKTTVIGGTTRQQTTPKTPVIGETTRQQTTPKTPVIGGTTRQQTTPKTPVIGETTRQQTTPKTTVIGGTTRQQTTPKTTVIGGTTRQQTTPKTTEIDETTRPQTTRKTTKEPTKPTASTARIPGGGNEDESGKSKDVVKIVVLVALVLFILIILIILLLCLFFRKQILERYRKFKLSKEPRLGKSKSNNYSTDHENLSRPSTTSERDQDLNQRDRTVPKKNPGDKNPEFTSLSLIPESKIGRTTTTL